MKIICVGRNYIDHAKELGNAVPSNPVIFLKPQTALIAKKQPFFIPDFSEDVHYEAELVVKINRLGKNIQPKFAHKYYKELTVGIDFTARDLQRKLKDKGLPWEKAKAFDGSAAIGEFHAVSSLNDTKNINFFLKKNGEKMQNGYSKDMIFSINELISHISSFFTLKIGDLIFTGTPAGVGKVNVNDHLELFLEERPVFSLNVK